MTLRSESSTARGHWWLDSRGSPYSPNLGRGETRELLDLIQQGQPWRLPSQHQSTGDKLLSEWVRYLDQVQRGYAILDRAVKKHIIQGDSSDFNAYLYFNRGGIEVTKENIQSVRRTIIALLSPMAREALNVTSSKRSPSKQDIKKTRIVVQNFVEAGLTE